MLKDVKIVKMILKRIFGSYVVIPYLKKTVEDTRNRRNFQLITNEKKLQKEVNKPTFKDCKIFDKNLLGVSLMKGKIKLNKPIMLVKLF